MFTRCVNDDIIFTCAAFPGYNESICRGWRLVFPVVCRGYQYTPQLYWFLICRHETEQVFGHGRVVCGLWSNSSGFAECSLSVFSGLSQWRQGLGFQLDFYVCISTLHSFFTSESQSPLNSLTHDINWTPWEARKYSFSQKWKAEFTIPFFIFELSSICLRLTVGPSSCRLLSTFYVPYR